MHTVTNLSTFQCLCELLENLMPTETGVSHLRGDKKTDFHTHTAIADTTLLGNTISPTV